MVDALVRACVGKVGDWPRLLPYALLAYRTTQTSVKGFMPTELMYGQKLAMPWNDEMSREDRLDVQIRQLERRPRDLKLALEKLKEARLYNK